ncbi:MAG: flippase-like domain-containing protein [Bacteroidales bacterium]|nr:flippase-like domain-containing protein [Bacteroidales bacterium]
MKKKIINTIKYLLFLAVGIFLFWLVYKDLKLDLLKEELKNINYWWIILSVLIGLLSHYSRALRWNMLIHPLGYKPKTMNSFMAVMVMYLTNLAIPRAGEIARCSVLTKYEKISFSKLVGTVVVERTTDVIALIFFAALIMLSQISVIQEFLQNYPETYERIKGLFSVKNIIIITLIIIIFFISIFIFRKTFKKTKLYKKIAEILQGFIEGIKTITHLKNKWIYIGHTVFIYVMWLIAMYVIFFSFKPTSHLTILAAMGTFVMGALAMIAPVQGGIGPYHFMVIEALFIYGIDKTDGKIFALVAHAAANLPLMFFGLISLIILPFINRNYNPTEPST